MRALARIAVIGAGYVGLTAAACLAKLGNDVVAVEIDRARARVLRSGSVPFHEPGLSELVAQVVRRGRLSFTTDYPRAIPQAEFVFLAVPTPDRRGRADLSAVSSAVEGISSTMTGPLIVVNKSTVPIGTGDVVLQKFARLHGEHAVEVASNPEFLREGSAVSDFLNPDRIVIGAHRREIADRVAHLYSKLQAPILITTIYSAEMIKYASNSFLAARISFVNEVARICERVGADISVVAEGMGLDHRIGPAFLNAGLGFGGSCFPKDVAALAGIARRNGEHPELLDAVLTINRDQRRLVVEKLLECLKTARGATVALLGLAFKPNTDDLRDAPSLDVARLLTRRGARVRAYDPAIQDTSRLAGTGIRLSKGPYEAAQGADAVILITEWDEFKHLDLDRLRRSMRQSVFVDGRNLFDPSEMRALGFVYRGVGRG